MRKIGELDTEKQALAFSDYLFVEGISNSIEKGSEGQVEIWIEDEDACARSQSALKRFTLDPDSPEFMAALDKAVDMRKEKRRRQLSEKVELRGRDALFRKNVLRKGGMRLTITLIAISVIVTLLSGGLGSGSDLVQRLSITEYHIVEGWLQYDRLLPEVTRGQVWRLVTPIFLHASLAGGGLGFLHLLFNMLWLRDLGGMIEKQQGTWRFLVKVLVIAVVSNVLQFAVSGPSFGGMSGVVFGLLGYAWVRGRLDLTSGLYVHNQLMLVMGAWFLICLTGLMGPVANAAHAGGLFSGMAWGWFSARYVNRR